MPGDAPKFCALCTVELAHQHWSIAAAAAAAAAAVAVKPLRAHVVGVCGRS